MFTLNGFLSLQVYRHGDRSPTHIYPNDPYQEDVWPQGIGMLTQVSSGNIFSDKKIKTQLENHGADHLDRLVYIFTKKRAKPASRGTPYKRDGEISKRTPNRYQGPVLWA